MEKEINSEIKKTWAPPDIVSLNSKETLSGLSSADFEDYDHLDLDPSLG